MLPVSMVGRAGELAELDRAWSSVIVGGRRSPAVAVADGPPAHPPTRALIMRLLPR
ncbi:hypothetical protein [Micromonospora lutea]|uniref:hypothetical protein n=1 Tax=Micromonospora lutea TaxID=419825 RepID=UPI001950B283|nr:hypothetical protein [Micromonospora lutea]